MSRNEQSGLEGGALKQLRILLEAESGDGLELLKDLEDNPICSISYDESDACIVVLWRRYATSTQLRFIHESIIGLIEKHGASKILGDDTALATNSCGGSEMDRPELDAKGHGRRSQGCRPQKPDLIFRQAVG